MILNKIAKQIIKKRFEKNINEKELLNPKYISIEISEKCNLKCRICNQWKESNNLKKLDFKDIKKLIDELRKYYPNVILEFSGPEPLMNKELLLKSLNYACSKNVHTALSTNGTLFSKEGVEILLNLNLNHISVSLDSSDPKINDYIRNFNGSFQIITQGIKRLVDHKKANKSIKTKLSVTCVVTDKNVKELTKVYYLCRKLGIDNINYNTYVSDNSYFFDKEKNIAQDEFWVKKENICVLKNQIKKILRIKEINSAPIISTNKRILRSIPDYFELKLNRQNQSCLAGFNYFHITNFGEVTVCGKGPYLNIRKMTIKEIWESEEFKDTRLNVKNCNKPCLNNCFRLD